MSIPYSWFHRTESAQITVRTQAVSEPVRTRERITTLDAIRGIAVLGILPMNVVSFGLAQAAYFNLDANGSDNWFDWLVGVVGEIFIDQKFMGLFSLLFGAGIVLFTERAGAKGRRPGWFSLWRNGLLLGIGVLHSLLWDGDVLIVYAVCAPILIALRKRSARTLLVLGTATVLLSAVIAAGVQQTVGADGSGLGDYWFIEGSTSDAVGLWLLADFFLRALGMMLIGVALYRTGVVTGARTPEFYRRMARWGLGVGLPLSVLGLAVVAANDFSAEVAVIGAVPNTVGTIPIVLGYLSLIVLWSLLSETGLHRRVQAVGRMALTNYLTQTVIGIIVLRGLFDSDDLSRGWLAVFVVAVWAVQLWWSQAWLSHFRYGPVEWAWQSATHRRWQPLRRETTAAAVAGLIGRIRRRIILASGGCRSLYPHRSTLRMRGARPRVRRTLGNRTARTRTTSRSRTAHCRPDHGSDEGDGRRATGDGRKVLKACLNAARAFLKDRPPLILRQVPPSNVLPDRDEPPRRKASGRPRPGSLAPSCCCSSRVP